MLATEGGRYGLTIRWPTAYRRSISRIIDTGRCPSWYVPHKVSGSRVPVALVDEDGTVLLLFTLAHIDFDPPELKSTFRCALVAVRGSVRRPGPKDHQRLPSSHYGEGQFAYFDPKTGERAIFNVSTGSRPDGGGILAAVPEMRFHTVLANNIAKTLSQPERDLISRYTKWIGRSDIFGHRYLPGPRMYTDLFIRPLYALIEAKSVIDRRTLRTALGQLLDYQRCFARHPRLAVLLPKKPHESMIGLFTSKRVAVIWQSRGKMFADSVGGAFTDQLR